MTTRDVAVHGHTQRFAALPTAPRLARVVVTQAATDWRLSKDCREMAELLVSELVTNAVKQTGRVDGPPTPRPTERVAIVTLWVHVVGRALRIDVWDNDPKPPEKVEQSFDAEGGRGLLLVEALSRAWGTYIPKGGGKVVWCEVAAGDLSVLSSTSTPAGKPLPKRAPTTTSARRTR